MSLFKTYCLISTDPSEHNFQQGTYLCVLGGGEARLVRSLGEPDGWEAWCDDMEAGMFWRGRREEGEKLAYFKEVAGP